MWRNDGKDGEGRKSWRIYWRKAKIMEKWRNDGENGGGRKSHQFSFLKRGQS